MKLIWLSVVVIWILQGCVAYPYEYQNREDYVRCDLITKEYDLRISDKPVKVIAHGSHAKDAIGILLLSGVVLSASTVVSGSMVLLGNTVHFLEKQGRCEDSFLNEKVLRFTKPYLEEGGELIDDSELSKQVSKKS